MADIKGTTARLRKAFRYPDDSSSTNTPEAMDEEEQETLITTLSAQNASHNASFRSLLLCLPALAFLPYLLALLSQPSRPLVLLALIACSSLASTAYILYALPPTATGIPFLDSLSSSSSSSSSSSQSRHSSSSSRRSRRSSFSVQPPDSNARGPLETWLPYMNLGLCAVLALMGSLARARLAGSHSSSPLSPVGLGLLPAVVYGVVLAAKVVMAGVDPEQELAALRYEYKGA